MPACRYVDGVSPRAGAHHRRTRKRRVAFENEPADVRAADQDGYTALHMAAFTGAASIVKFLVDRGASIDARNKLGETPWSMAAGMSPVLRYRGQYGSHESTAKLLLSLGAKPFTQDELDARAAAR